MSWSNHGQENWSVTPFYFLKAGSLIQAPALVAGAGLIGIFLAMRMATKFIGILPLTRYFQFNKRPAAQAMRQGSSALSSGFGEPHPHLVKSYLYLTSIVSSTGSVNLHDFRCWPEADLQQAPTDVRFRA